MLHNTSTKSEIKDKPILFSGEMVRAIQDGRKTQTRRVAKLPLDDFSGEDRIGLSFEHETGDQWRVWETEYPEEGSTLFKAPYQVGQKMWVRETFADLRGQGFDRPFGYAADTIPGSDGDAARIAYGIKWKPSIHMKREACRLELLVKAIRIERIQDGGDREFWGEKQWSENPWVWVIEFERLP